MTFISPVMAAEKDLQPGALPLLGLAAAVGGELRSKGPFTLSAWFRDEPGLAMFCRNVTIWIAITLAGDRGSFEWDASRGMPFSVTCGRTFCSWYDPILWPRFSIVCLSVESQLLGLRDSIYNWVNFSLLANKSSNSNNAICACSVRLTSTHIALSLTIGRVDLFIEKKSLNVDSVTYWPYLEGYRAICMRFNYCMLSQIVQLTFVFWTYV